MDTADAYGVGANEELLAEASPYADHLLIATKIGHTRPSPGEWKPVGRPEYLRQAAVVSVQSRYNLTDRHHDDVPKYCEAEGITFVPWLPIAGGTHGSSKLLADLSTETGASSETHLIENTNAADLWLTPTQLSRLDAIT
ncbi:hypothetical protein [Kribbella sp. NPDC051770]|uniref:hypothetical protein n=1 Tax=Kribbella sp. NPDC051770 TaxID=3155413 RepID=UPI0034336986